MQPRKKEKTEKRNRIKNKLTNYTNLLIKNAGDRIKNSNFNPKGMDILGVKGQAALKKLRTKSK